MTIYTQTDREEALANVTDGLESGREFEPAEMDHFAEVLRPENLDARRLDEQAFAYVYLLGRLRDAGRDLTVDETELVARAAAQEERDATPQTALEAHLWDLDHPEEAAALKAARVEELRALGIHIPADPQEEIERAEADGQLSGLVVTDHCAVCGAEVEVHLARSVCPDCRAPA